MEQKLIDTVAGQTGMSKNAVPGFLKKFIEKAKKNNPTKTEEEHIKIATDELLSRFKNVGMTQGKPISGIILGVTAPNDTTRGFREKALIAYAKDPAQAVKDGLVMEEFNPELNKNVVVALDNRQTWGTGTTNQGYGKPLVQSFLKNVFGIIKPEDMDAKIGTMTLNNEKAFMKVPLNQQCDFSGINKTLNGADEYTINQSSSTMFIPRENSKTDVPALIEKLAGKYIIEFDKLEEWTDQHVNDYTPAIVKCTIMSNTPIMEQEGKPNTSKAIIKVQDCTGNCETTITAWMPRIDDVVCDYGIGQDIYLIGRTKRVDIKDQNRQPTGETEIQFNTVMGVCPIGEITMLEGHETSETSMPKMPTTTDTPVTNPNPVSQSTPKEKPKETTQTVPPSSPPKEKPKEVVNEPSKENKESTPPSDGVDFS